MADKIIFDYTEDTTPARTDNVLLQSGISDVYTRAQIANILGTLIAADIPDISATYALVSALANYLDKATYDSNDDGVLDVSTIPDISATYATQADIADLVTTTDQSNIYYVGKHGNDSNDGLTIEKAKLTFSNAMSAASSGDAIVCFDNGVYAEGITAKDGVNVFAPNATLNVTGSQLVAAESTIQFNKITRTTGSNAMVFFGAASGVRQKVVANVVDDEGDGIAFRFAGSAIPIVHVKEFYVSGGGIGIGDFIGAEHYHVVIDDLYMNSNNAIGIQGNASSDFGIATIQHIVDLGFTGTVAIDMDAGSLALISQQIGADTAIDIASGATLNLIGNNVTGTVTNAGTYNKWVADDRAQTQSTSVLIESPDDKDYRLIVNLPKAITITKVTTICVSGTATATVKINSTALGGTANSVSSTEDEQAHSSSNAAAAGDDIVLTISANSNCTDMSLTIEYTLELD